MIKYLMWNPYKVSEFLDVDIDEQTVQNVLEQEQRLSGSIVSVIEVVDAEQAQTILDAVRNETDAEHIRFEPIVKELTMAEIEELVGHPVKIKK